MAKRDDVRYIRLQFTDILGTIKAVEIPASKLKEALEDFKKILSSRML